MERWEERRGKVSRAEGGAEVKVSGAAEGGTGWRGEGKGATADGLYGVQR